MMAFTKRLLKWLWSEGPVLMHSLSNLGAGKQLFTLQRPSLAAQEGNGYTAVQYFQGHTVKLLKCIGTQAALLRACLAGVSYWLQGSHSELCQDNTNPSIL